MFIFLRLVLAHFIGDFLLQFDKVYELKNKGILGGIPHATLVTSCFIALAWPYYKLPELWFLIIFMGLSHLIQDSIKISYGQRKYSFWLYLLDQAAHILLISTVFLTSLKNVTPPAGSGIWVGLYNNDSFILYLIALIFATYNGFYLIRSFSLTFGGRAGVYTSFEKWYGMMERALTVFLFALGGDYIILIPVAFLIRLAVFSIIHKKKSFIRARFVAVREMGMSWFIALATGISFYFIKGCLLSQA